MIEPEMLATLPPFVQRMGKELKELQTKIKALVEFTTTSKVFDNLPVLDQGLLQAQLSSMQAYARILLIRLEKDLTQWKH